jgi:chaperonin GroEL
MARWIASGERARRSARRASTLLAKAVGATLGPGGRTVVLDQRWKGPVALTDGASIARELEFANPFDDLALQIIKQAAAKVKEHCGDGATTTILLACAMLEESLRLVAAGAESNALVRGMRVASEAVAKQLPRLARPIETRAHLEAVAALACKDSVLAHMLASAIADFEIEPACVVAASKSRDLQVEKLEGFQSDGGCLSEYFIADRKHMQTVLEDPHILITDASLHTTEDILPALERILPLTTRILIVCGDADGEALAGLAMNRQRGLLDVVVVKAPGLSDRRRELLQDLAIATGGQLLPDVDSQRPLSALAEADLGRAERAVASMDKTLIIGGRGNAEERRRRCADLKRQLDDAQTEQFRDKLWRRIGGLEGRLIEVRVGAATVAEARERKKRAENAVASMRLAIRSGTVAGGGVALLNALRNVVLPADLSGDERLGREIIERALALPLNAMARNAGIDTNNLINRHTTPLEGHGINFATGEFGNLREMGIIEPCEMVASVLRYATSVAAGLISTETMLVYPPDSGPLGEKLDMSAKYE